MSYTSARLSLSYLAEAQAQKHVTINETVRRLDALVHLCVKSAAATDQPSTVQEGDAYILGAGAAGGAWSGASEGTVAAFQDGAWSLLEPAPGMVAFVEGQGLLVAYDGTGWTGLTRLPKLGVNTAADETNRVAVKSDAVLLSHDDVTPGSGDVRIVVNKAADANTASFLFQDNFAGKAELGLTGSNDFAIKVADDQGTFREAIVIDRQTGAVRFPNTL